MDICDYAVGLSRMLGGRVMPSESKLISNPYFISSTTIHVIMDDEYFFFICDDGTCINVEIFEVLTSDRNAVKGAVKSLLPSPPLGRTWSCITGAVEPHWTGRSHFSL